MSSSVPLPDSYSPSSAGAGGRGGGAGFAFMCGSWIKMARSPLRSVTLRKSRFSSGLTSSGASTVKAAIARGQEKKLLFFAAKLLCGDGRCSD